MKLKILLIVTIISIFSACNSNSSNKEKINVLEGTYQATEFLTSKTYQVTENGGIYRMGYWVFSRDEITILLGDSDNLVNTYSNLSLVAVQKYYIKNDIIYTCLCHTSDCLDKEKNYEKTWKIESVSQTNAKRIVMLTSVL